MIIIDLSMPLYSNMEVYPGDPEVKIEVIQTYEKNNWNLSALKMGTHTGTHVDAFSHMYQGKESLDDIPLNRFFGKATVINDSEAWPSETGLFFIQETSLESLERIVISNPGFVGGNITEALERALLGRNIITYTGLVNLEFIPQGKQFMFYGLPLKIQSGDGSPVRAIAIIEDEWLKLYVKKNFLFDFP